MSELEWRTYAYRTAWVLGWQAGVNDGDNNELGSYNPKYDQPNGGGLFETAGVRLAYALEMLPIDLQSEAEDGYVHGYIQATEHGPVDGPMTVAEQYRLRRQLAGRVAEENARYQAALAR